MDPVGTVLAAILVGISSGVGDLAKDEVKRAYGALKKRISERFSQVNPAVDLYEENSSSVNARNNLQNVLEATHAAEDEEVLTLAKSVLSAANTSAENILRMGDEAEVTDSPQAIEVQGKEFGNVRNEMVLGKGAKVSGSGQSIRTGRSPEAGNS
jgi:hypothetical protein